MFSQVLKVIHSDLKPENILLMRNKMIKLSDYGLTKDMTKCSGQRGTLQYSAPGKI